MKLLVGIGISDQLLEERDAFRKDQIYKHDKTAAKRLLVLSDQALALIPLGMLGMKERTLTGKSYLRRIPIGKLIGFPLRD